MRKTSLSGIEKKVLAVVQEGFPESLKPYEEMAERCGIKVEKLLGVLRGWKEEGKLRRTGAIVSHFKVGKGAGAMVAWRAKPKQVKKTGQILAGFKEVSHVYERQVGVNWPYNLYSMVHGENQMDLKKTIGKMSEKCQIDEYRVLVTEKELKKVKPTYIKK